jgi:hypothetical protein
MKRLEKIEDTRIVNLKQTDTTNNEKTWKDW